MTIEHKVIWLQPWCRTCKLFGDERVWCEDPQDDCEECGKKWVRYERSPALSIEKAD